MASIFAKRGMLWLGWYEKGLNGERVHPQIPLKLKDNKENRRIADTIKKQKEIELNYRQKTYYQKIELDDAIMIFKKAKEDRAERTKKVYYYALQILKNNSPKYANDVTSETIDRIKLQLMKEKKSKATIATYLKHIKIFFNYLIQQKLISDNPVEKIEYSNDKQIRTLSDEQVYEIFEHFRRRNLKHYHFLKLLYLTGLRVSEAVNLKWDDLDVRNKLLRVRNLKAKREELFPLTNEMIKFFNEIKKTGNKVFDYKNTDSLKTIKNELIKLGNYTFHDFRRTFGTKWAGVLKPFELKKIMRHKDIRTTDKHYVNMELNEIGNKMEAVAKWLLKDEKSVQKCEKSTTKKSTKNLKLLKFR